MPPNHASFARARETTNTDSKSGSEERDGGTEGEMTRYKTDWLRPVLKWYIKTPSYSFLEEQPAGNEMFDGRRFCNMLK